jgi:hypothetical protein
MIFNTSRYSNGVLGQVIDGHADNPTTYVYRRFGFISNKQDYFLYQVSEVDRIDTIASNFLGDPKYWYRIMDINPDIKDPFLIPTGTVIRVPNVSGY